VGSPPPWGDAKGEGRRMRDAIELSSMSKYSFFMRSCPKAVILTLILFAMAMVADARDLRVRKKTEGHTIDATLNRNPPILGNNEIAIQIRDSADKAAVLTAVIVNYYMPPMPGMPPMNYTLRARQNNDTYRATMNLIMSGPWIIAIRAIAQGKTLRMEIPIDVR
jgi:hypothetical protein